MAEVIAVLFALIVLLAIGAAARYVRRHGLSRMPTPDSTQLVGMTVVEAFRGESKGAALQEAEFMRKSWREDGESGDDISRRARAEVDSRGQS